MSTPPQPPAQHYPLPAKKKKSTAIIVLALVGGLIAICGIGGIALFATADGDSSTSVPLVGKSDDEPGGRKNPFAPGTEFTAGDWQVALDSTVIDATDQVLAENQFNEPPVEGRQFVMVNVKATYNGSGSATAFTDLLFKFYGSEGNTFGTDPENDYCGVIPNDLSSQNEAFEGAEIVGNACVSVPTEQIDGGAWLVSTIIDQDKAFVALS